MRELRKSKKLTMKELGKIFSLAESTISGYESGARKPDIDQVKKFADYFNVQTDYLLGRTDEKKSDWDSNLPELSEKDERDIAKKLQNIIDDLESGASLAFDGEPMDEDTRELVIAQIERNLRLTKKHAKQKFTPKKYRDK